LGVRTVGDVARLPPARLERVFGERSARHFARLARGEDEREVEGHHQRKSIGKETTFLEDLSDRGAVEATLLGLTESVARRLRKGGLRGRTVTVKLRTADFHTITRQSVLERPADTVEEIWPLARELFRKADSSHQAIRLIGVAVSAFGEEPQLSLFAPAGHDKSRKIAQAMDAVAERFGERAVVRGRTTRGARDAARSKGRSE
jgi:DNA polymerase-4